MADAQLDLAAQSTISQLYRAISVELAIELSISSLLSSQLTLLEA